MLTTAFTELLGVPHPIACAPMGGTAGGELAAAVSRAGGLGMVGAGAGQAEFLARELPVAAGTGQPWGVGFLTWATQPAAVESGLAYGPTVVMLSFGDPRPYVPAIRAVGALLMLQVTDLEEAREALDVGADVLVAQGSESGGHGARNGTPTMAFLPQVLELANTVPVLAAGGIVDGKDLAVALSAGASGALIGTRFHLSAESLVEPQVADALAAARGQATERSSVLDIARGAPWPRKWDGRSLSHPVLDAWRGREDELEADEDAKQALRDALARGELPSLAVWASSAVDRINDRPSAGELVAAIVREAELAVG